MDPEEGGPVEDADVAADVDTDANADPDPEGEAYE